MHDTSTRLREQNNGEPWIDCNERGRPHHWVFETSKSGRTWFKCKRCPVATVSSKLDSDGRRVHPAPWLRPAQRVCPTCGSHARHRDWTPNGQCSNAWHR